MGIKNFLTERDLIIWLDLKNRRQARSLREKGMPHLKLSAKNIRYDPAEVEQWMVANAKK